MSIYIPQNLTMVMKNAWWIMVLRGVMVAILGLIVLRQPEASVFILAQLVGAYLLVDGVFVAFGAFRHRASESRWWLVLLRGLLGVVAGLFIILNPFSTTQAAVYVVGLLALLAGILEIVAAIRIRKEVSNEWTMAIAGLISIVLGLVLLVNPVGSVELLLTIVGIGAIIAGIVFIIGGIRLRFSSGG